MMFEALLSVAITTAVLLGSPGPAPLALAATAASQGVKKGFPFLAGILTGLLVAVIFAATGVAGLLVSHPQVTLMLKWLAAAYLIYVAYKIAANNAALGSAGAQLPSFKDGFILNLLNPKAYAACIAIFSTASVPASSNLVATLLAASVCYVVAIVVDTMWLVLGGVIFKTLNDETVLKRIRIGFALTLVVLVLYGLFVV
ncbi:LysE family translocator [Pseudoalteromonas piscicida]|uniref:LysE family translocator n=1 Tax=Pseudoalteromonas piscicida TaxID=43662 RepID=UPI001EFE45DA|nr:LysE family translocator [Pseudoalteromonas piscicida]MCG9768382.1 LysE family translocator [Pseudoalteromonas piscicida]